MGKEMAPEVFARVKEQTHHEWLHVVSMQVVSGTARRLVVQYFASEIQRFRDLAMGSLHGLGAFSSRGCLACTSGFPDSVKEPSTRAALTQACTAKETNSRMADHVLSASPSPASFRSWQVLGALAMRKATIENGVSTGMWVFCRVFGTNMPLWFDVVH